jgi:hypothetical protein
MPAILADVNNEGQLKLLIDLLLAGPLSEIWLLLAGPLSEIWLSLNFQLESFANLGLSEKAPDVQVWQTCQQHQVVLVTSNRNRKGSDSLEATLRTFNTPDSLPVITLANPQLLMSNKSYAERVAGRLLDYLFELENYRGAGRLYVP